MFGYLLGLAVLYWVGISVLCYARLNKMFKKYKNTPRLQVPDHYTAFLRMDFGKWEQKALLKRSFTHFPLRFTCMASTIVIYAVLGKIYSFMKIPPLSFINHLRKLFGKTSVKLMLNIRQQFDANEKLVTPIVIANHSTFLDILYFGFCLQSILSFVSKKEIQKLPFVRQCASFIQTILLDRSSAQARSKVKAVIEERVRKFENDNKNVFPLLIFPQGTVSNGRSLMHFRNGAFQPLCPITIFSLRYQSKQFHMGDNELSFIDHILVSLCAKCDLIVSKKVVYPNENQTVDDYRERCRKQLSEMGNFKIYDCSYKDYLQYDRLFKAKLAQLKSKAVEEAS